MKILLMRTFLLTNNKILIRGEEEFIAHGTHHRKGGVGLKNNWIHSLRCCRDSFSISVSLFTFFHILASSFPVWQGKWPLAALNSHPRNFIIREERYYFCSFKPEISWSRTLQGSCAYPNLRDQTVGLYYWLSLVHMPTPVVKNTESIAGRGGGDSGQRNRMTAVGIQK